VTATNSKPSGLTAIPRQDPPSIEVTRHLLRYLLSGQVARGQRIPSERNLAEALGIGRTAVREAIKSLSLLGLLVVRQGDGTYLTDSPASLLPEVIEWGLLLGEPHIEDIIEARANLEAFNASLAARRGGPDGIRALRRTVSAMGASGAARGTYVQADIDFHSQIAEMTQNGVLADLARSFQSLLRAWVTKVIEADNDAKELSREHEAIVDAIAAGEAAAARRAMDRHMKTAARRLRDAMAAEGGPDGSGSKGGPARRAAGPPSSRLA
jgi:GntR family transcriptional repressor for pyruvate dehydrogenase complex